MEGLLGLSGAVLARAYALYGMVLLVLSLSFVNLVLLVVVVRAAALHSRGSRPWPNVPVSLRRWARLTVGIAFGLINPVLYLAILAPALPGLRSGAGWWLGPLTTGAWTLLAAFWTLRLLGAGLDSRSRTVRAAIRALLVAALACVLLYTFKDAWLLPATAPAGASPFTLALNILGLCPLYLLPSVLLWDYIRSASASSELRNGYHGLFLLPDRAARVAVAGVAGVALLTVTVTAYRRSDASVRKLVIDHRESILAAAVRYDIDPRLIASIVYVTHRDQVSPFRDALERVVISAWARNPGSLSASVGSGEPRVEPAPAS